MKFCGTCKTVRSLESFCQRSESKDGRSYKCRGCTKSYNRKRYAEQRDYSRKHGQCVHIGCGTLVYFSSNYCERHYYRKAAFNGMGSERYWELLQEKAYQQNFICVITGDSLIPGENMSLDHIKPRSLYPDLVCDENNIQWITKWANIAKSNLGMDEFIKRCVNIVNRHN